MELVVEHLSGAQMRILDVFTRRVAKVGYAETTLSGIATELSISKGTIVHHFGTKERLLATMNEEFMAVCVEELESMLNRNEGGSCKLASILHSLALLYKERHVQTLAVQREVVRLDELHDFVEGRRHRERYSKAIQGLIADGVEEGVFRQEVDPQLQMLLIFGSIQWAWTWFDPDGRLSADALGQGLVELALGSLLVDRKDLAELSSPAGKAARIARQTFGSGQTQGLRE